MKKKIIVWLIIAISFILVGGIIFVGVMNSLKWDFKVLDTAKYETNIYNITDQFENISLKTNTADVVFLRSEDENCKIECLESEKEKHTVSIQDLTLEIGINDTREWYDHIALFNFDTTVIKLYLPKDKYNSLLIKASTGDIEIPNDFTFGSIDIKGSTCDIDCQASTINDLNFELSTGDIEIENITAGDINLVITTGDIDVSNVNCASFASSGSTGDIELEKVDAGKSFYITRNSGDVTIDECDADELFVQTNTGDVSGNLLTSKIFVCKTDTGEINLPNTTEGGKCEIITDTGDIIISVKKNMTSGYYVR